MGEDDARKVARHQDHEQRLRSKWEFAAEKASEYETRMKSAFRSRQKWKTALAEVVLAHEVGAGGKCSCGADGYPCFTVKKLEEANRGIAREIEQLGTLPDRELDRELYPDEAPQEWNEAF